MGAVASGVTALPRYRLDPDAHPPVLCPEYTSNPPRAPRRPLLALPQGLTEITGPLLGEGRVGPTDHDLTAGGEPQGQRIVVTGRVRDGDGHPIAGTLVEIWQANAAGRYRHDADQHDAPLDPDFTGAGRCLTDADGRYEFVTVQPGAYPWKNHHNAWRPAHIHFSLLGRAFAQRLVTQMYFPGDPLLALDPIFQSVRNERAKAALVAAFDLDATVPDRALGYRWDIVLRGRSAIPFDDGSGAR